MNALNSKSGLAWGDCVLSKADHGQLERLGATYAVGKGDVLLLPAVGRCLCFSTARRGEPVGNFASERSVA